MALYGISREGSDAMQKLANELCSSVDGLTDANRRLKTNIAQYMDVLGIYGAEIWALTLSMDGLLQDKSEAIRSLAEKARNKSMEIMSIIGFDDHGYGPQTDGTNESWFKPGVSARNEKPDDKWASDYMPLVKANIRQSVATHFAKYVSGERLEQCLDALSFLSQSELRRRYEAGGKSMPQGVLGYNDGNSSFIASNMKGTTYNGRVGEHAIQGSENISINYAFVTAVHENLHMMSANDVPGEARRGIMIGENEEARAMNEAFTEYYTYLSCGGNRPLGGLYPGSYSGYQILMQEMPTIESAVGSDCMMEAYFHNKPQLMQQRIDGRLGSGAWHEMCLASYDLMYNGNENKGAERLLRLLNRLKNPD